MICKNCMGMTDMLFGKKKWCRDCLQYEAENRKLTSNELGALIHQLMADEFRKEGRYVNDDKQSW